MTDDGQTTANARLGNRYQIVRLLGSGGMGQVFQAVDTETGRTVAAKVLVAGGDIDLTALLRFQQEGAVLSTLKHPNIVEVYGTFLEEHTSCIIMELLEGRSLAQILRAEHLSLSRIKHIMAQVAAALAFAHSRGIVHRDVKPDNIMVVGDDQVKVTDFGIARVLRTGATLNTAVGTSIGTPLYMAPEQIEGQKVDSRADIYALGAVMYQCVTGHPPFEGEDPLSIAFKHVHKAPQPPSQVNADVPADWEAVILKALAKDPGDRFQTAAAFEEAIQSLSLQRRAGGITIGDPAPPAGAWTPPPATSPPTIVEPPDRIEDGALGSTVIVEPDATGAFTDRRVETPAPVEKEAPPPAAPAERRRAVPWLPIGLGAGLIVAAVAVAVVLATRSSTTHTATTARTLVATWGSAGSGPGQFQDPEGIAVDSQGNTYVADAGNNRIQKLSPSGDVKAMLGNAEELNMPTGVALDAQGNIYVADSVNSRIVKLSPDGRVLTAWGHKGTAPGQFDGPHGVAVDGQANIFVADFGNNRVQKLKPNRNVFIPWGTRTGGSDAGQFNEPVNVAVDAQGNVYVADFKNNRVQKISPDGKRFKFFTQAGPDGLDFMRPHGVAVDSHGTVYVADYHHNVVQALSPSGKALAQVGRPGSGQGHLLRPSQVAVDQQGNLYVADSGNNRIEKFSP